MSPEYLSTKEAAKRLDLSESTLKNMIKGKIIEAHKLVPGIKSVYRIPTKEVERILKERTKT